MVPKWILLSSLLGSPKPNVESLPRSPLSPERVRHTQAHINHFAPPSPLPPQPPPSSSCHNRQHQPEAVVVGCGGRGRWPRTLTLTHWRAETLLPVDRSLSLLSRTVFFLFLFLLLFVMTMDVAAASQSLPPPPTPTPRRRRRPLLEAAELFPLSLASAVEREREDVVRSPLPPHPLPTTQCLLSAWPLSQRVCVRVRLLRRRRRELGEAMTASAAAAAA